MLGLYTPLPTTAVCMGAICGDVPGSTFDSHHIKT